MRPFKPPKTTRFERLLLASVIVLLPLENNFTPGGYSLAFILFGVTMAFAVVRHPKTLMRTAFHPVFVAAFLFLLYSAVIESIHLNSDYEMLRRTAQMVAGGMVIASYCRDPKALRTTMFSFVVMGGGLALYLLLSVLGVLSVASASDMGTATMVRNSVFEGQFVRNNLNTMAAHVALGSSVCLVLWTTSSRVSRRTWLMLTFLICLTGVFLPMSRSGIFIAMVLYVLILFLRGFFRVRTFLMGLAIAVVILTVVPDVVLKRMSFSMVQSEGSGLREGRARVLLASIDAISEEPLLGVGSGNFWGRWGMWSGFYTATREGVVGAHNAYFQIIIYWGAFSCFLWGFLFWTAFRRLPQPFGDNRIQMLLLVLFTWAFLLSLFTHVIYGKSFSLILGVLVGVDHFIRPFYPLERLGYKES